MLSTRLDVPELRACIRTRLRDTQDQVQAQRGMDSLQVSTVVLMTGLGGALIWTGGFMCLFRVCGRLWPRSNRHEMWNFAGAHRTGSIFGIKARGGRSIGVSTCMSSGIALRTGTHCRWRCCCASASRTRRKASSCAETKEHLLGAKPRCIGQDDSNPASFRHGILPGNQV